MSKKENTAQKRAFLRAIKQGLKEVKGGNTLSLNEARRRLGLTPSNRNQ